MNDAATNPAASAPAEPETFAEFRAQRAVSASAPPAEGDASAEGKPAPESDPESREAAPPAKPGNDDQRKSERKRRNDERREREWWEERGEMRARLKALEDENNALKSRSADGKTETPQGDRNSDGPTGKPVLKDFLNSGKFKTYEDAQEAYQDARDEWNRQAWEAQQENVRAQRTAQETQKAYTADAEKFAEGHEDYDEAFDAVSSALERGKGGNPLTTAILRSKSPAALIYHLGKNEDALDELSELVGSGDFGSALMRLGEIKAQLAPAKPAAAASSTKTKTPASLVRPPAHVSGRGSGVPARDEQLRAASDANDFAAFRRANRRAS
jgi:hypothetical protein